MSFKETDVKELANQDHEGNGLLVLNIFRVIVYIYSFMSFEKKNLQNLALTIECFFIIRRNFIYFSAIFFSFHDLNV